MIQDQLPTARALSDARKELRLRALLGEIQQVPSLSGARSTRRSWRLVTATAVVASGVCGWVAVGTLSGADPAYASWTPSPSAVAAAQVEELGQTCNQRLPHPPAEQPPAMAPVLAEQRGAFSAVLLGSPDRIAVCVSGKHSWIAGYTDSPTLDPGQVLAVTGNGGKTSGSDAARYVYGRLSPSGAAVTVETSDGRHVTASVRDGYYFAWWPSAADPTKIIAADSAGSTVASTQPALVPHS
ncbi:hypothetical protein C7C46_01925 [Streptomyces tateyamensis]|uniref:Uncharacterized protein n=1 Tax=Streptomyces tateyamensis TaxID=565073 RepID=A0A2V4P0F2_9ACTN|nr:hypothetical protein [Streptomyces tateyamensis]PYC88050.1 hypothetical protein C7C46_01925 [Streptomyces tateyamensis]